ncbi:Immunoglobulin subtype,Immunoglobulin-like domain,Immunoglobulin-like fold,Leucine-rich repeat [Cinara cedri]|uniref:Immunoglobulin subtype,Immunoglobulin-like domain,Immunoglobulin-like fold,Leucine-rich repeat n=1 Tax=Cinara cedri TaxID=506608 RepID=A0A5E4MXR6_9HEMI|nr:Immunoglobulin subtype,Immunoglobulin-like domain,Immunoglobulin-like fold,Leucine-rich repeat [Cinara cedri]
MSRWSVATTVGDARLWWWCLFAVVTVLAVTAARAETCPVPCVCKWKSGKQSVDCKSQNLITVPQGIDSATQVLDISGSNLQILPAEAFYRFGLLNLQRVYLTKCRIGQIDSRALRGLTNVIEIDLSNNLLTAVPSATFSDVPLLRDLSLANNPIQKIEPDAFRNCAGLVQLDMSGCELHAVAATAFVGIDRLETLKLAKNRLTGLLAGTMQSLNKVHGVELHENPWHCDCTMRPVKMWLIKNNIPTAVDPLCATGPGRVANRTFSTLTADDFACRPDIQQDDPTVEAATGDNASVSCRVHSSPAAKVSWYWNGRALANNTAFGPFQRVFMTDDRTGSGHSSLLLTNVQPSDSGQFLCVAENRAGRAEANFTLVVTRLGGLAFLANRQVASLSVFLVFLIITILLVIVYLLVRIKRLPPTSTRPDGKPHQLMTTAASATSNGTAVVVQVKQPVTTATVVTASTSPTAGGYRGGAMFNPVPLMEPVLPSSAGETVSGGGCRRPKLTELAFAADHHYEGGFGNSNALDVGRTVLYRSQPSNPDLIADATEQTPAANSPAAAVAAQANHHHPQTRRSGSGEYRRTADESLYSPGFWAQSDVAANDRTPIIEKSPPLPPLPGAAVPQAALASRDSMATTTAATVTDPKAASLRVWKHGVQVMPPLSALKRALNKGSPDEGYQEGCGTDV